MRTRKGEFDYHWLVVEELLPGERRDDGDEALVFRAEKTARDHMRHLKSQGFDATLEQVIIRPVRRSKR